MTPFFDVLRVVKVLPQVHVTVVSTYSGWMPLFTCSLLGLEVAGSCCAVGAREPEPASVCQTPQRGRRHGHSPAQRRLRCSASARSGGQKQSTGRATQHWLSNASVVVAATGDRRRLLHRHEELEVAPRLL